MIFFSNRQLKKKIKKRKNDLQGTKRSPEGVVQPPYSWLDNNCWMGFSIPPVGLVTLSIITRKQTNIFFSSKILELNRHYCTMTGKHKL